MVDYNIIFGVIAMLALVIAGGFGAFDKTLLMFVAMFGAVAAIILGDYLEGRKSK